MIRLDFPFFRVAVLSALLGLAAVPRGHAWGDRMGLDGSGMPDSRSADPAGCAIDTCGL